MRRLLLLIAFILSSQSCSLAPVVPDKQTISPFGVFKIVNFKSQSFELIINKDLTYQICGDSGCFAGEALIVPAGHGIILKDFYTSEQGKVLESLSFGRPLSKEFLLTVRKLRNSQPRPNDFAFNLTLCDATPCARLGHSRKGILFIRKR